MVEEHELQGLGNRMRSKREDVGLSQRALASKVGVTPSAINQFEKGQKRPSATVLASIAAALKVSADFILSGNPTEEEDVKIAFREFKGLSDNDKRTIMQYIAFLKEQAKE